MWKIVLEKLLELTFKMIIEDFVMNIKNPRPMMNCKPCMLQFEHGGIPMVLH
jgi:hypothetical protein